MFYLMSHSNTFYLQLYGVSLGGVGSCNKNVLSASLNK